MAALPAPLRRQLERAVVEARRASETGAGKSLRALGVDQAKPPAHLTPMQRDLHGKLRAQAKLLADTDGLKHLTEKVAYDQWHRLLFSRFLVENELLIHPEHKVALSLADLEDLAAEESIREPWDLAARYTSALLPAIFRPDDPAGALMLPSEDRAELLRLLRGLPADTFTASDSLGWCYQFWQAERKDEVNAAGNKIGADELPAVTQLFTEDYMVDFLLDNTLGAWHAGKVLAAIPKLAETAQSEDELRQAVSLPGCPWKYLRFIKGQDGKWTPAAGTFDGWPKSAKELKCLDPCMGSGHFVVAMFQRLVALRMAEEKLDEPAAVAAVIRDNLFGLELDPRCTQIGAFNLALAAWRRVGHCALPAMNLACSGLAPNTREADWLAIAGDNQKLQRGMERLYRLFQKAAVLGSLINPRAGEFDLLVAAFHELQPLLEKALAQEAKDDTAHEMAVTARGLAKAAEILAGQFTLVATNVPYLGRGKQDDLLMDYCERVHPEAKADLATCFVERCLDFCGNGGSTGLVTPQNWLFLGGYMKLRQRLLAEKRWESVARLGEHAFDSTQAGGAFVALVTISSGHFDKGYAFSGFDVASGKNPDEKAEALAIQSPSFSNQRAQLTNPDARIILGEALSQASPLGEHCECYQGIVTGDQSRFCRGFWEILKHGSDWAVLRASYESGSPYSAVEQVLFWQGGRGQLHEYARQTRDQLHDMHESGNRAWGRNGVAVNRMRNLRTTLYFGEHFENCLAVIVPKDQKIMPAVWAFCSDPSFEKNVRALDQKVSLTNATLVKVPFDLAHWQKVAADKYPHGLPKPFSSDPTQWLFNGHPAGADQPLQVAVARLLGYQWPRQTGSSFPDCPALAPDGLEKLADDDGIVPISPAKGEGPAAERLRELLARAYGKDWNATKQEELLAQVDYAGATLEDW
ncbi:MAG: BREX-1 system adenine-specific DNA-methyltransferase PglX, partial [Verrucomicrobiota bacterium]|nr:BREX-1 system adenine-specific DNA-methyltransferase PglX [Verrucomicrobiota bacterium]